MIKIFQKQYFFSLLTAALLCHASFVFAEEGATGAANYVSLEEPIIVNIFGQSRIHFMQVKTDFQLKDAALAPLLERHMAAVKHSLVLLFSEKRFFEMKTMRGKLQLRKDALHVVQQVMLDKTGDKTVEKIFFTSLVLQ